MIRILPFILIPLLILGGLGYWRYKSSQSNLTTPQTNESPGEPIEVPKTLPEATVEERVKALENLANKLVIEVNKLKSSNPQASALPQTSSLESAVTELKARVSALEKATPAPASAAQSAIYIPLATNGGPWADKDWYTTTYEISLDTANYPNYTGMVLEVIFRLAQKSGTGSVRLYNVSDSTGYSQVDTTSDSFSLKSSSSFKVASGSKTYKLQVKSNEGADLYIQSARLKVNF